MNKNLIILFITVAFSLTGRAQLITTIAGDGVGGYNGDNIAASTAKLQYPMSVAADNAGNIYIGDIGNHRIRKISKDGIISTYGGNGTAGYSGDGGPATAAQLDAAYMTVDNLGYLYFTDPIYNRVRVITPNGMVRCVGGTGAGGFSGDGGAATAAEFNHPMGIATDDTGNVYVADNGNDRIRKITYRGIVSTIAGGGTTPLVDSVQATSVFLWLPDNIAIDATNNLYVCSGNNIRKIGTDGVITSMGKNGSLLTTFINQRHGIIAIASDLVYVSESETNVVRKIDDTAAYKLLTATIVAGSWRKAGNTGDNGPATAAKLYMPAGVAMDKAGNIYIADYGNHNVRRINSGKSVKVPLTKGADNMLTVYPNPAKGLLTVHVNTLIPQEVSVQIVNVTGQVVKTAMMSTGSPGNIILDMPPGNYLLTAATGKESWCRLLIVE